MIVKITSKRQVTFPARVLEALGVRPGESPLPALRRCAASFGADMGLSISNPSAISHMTRHFGIDTSVLVRLLTGEPAADHLRVAFPNCSGWNRHSPGEEKSD